MARVILLALVLAFAIATVALPQAVAKPDVPGVCDIGHWGPGCWDPSNGCPPPPMYCMPP